MEARRLKDKRPAGKSSEARVDVQSEHLDSTHTDADAGPLVQDRDPTGINQSLKVTFEDVIAEPPSVRSLDPVWLWSRALFEASRLWCYRLVGVLLAVSLWLAAGLLFAALSCLHIWLLTPGPRLLRISMRWARAACGRMLSVLLGPFLCSAAKCCSRIHLYLAEDAC
ncbi:caveolin-2-like [Betta splendens]|uniref:Caveolin n=1 Tax=Betta splendens TaxID=158456 RepID=A0A6P7MKD8_BETSP|nr:caveolin-2-like [Betta splendens]